MTSKLTGSRDPIEIEQDDHFSLRGVERFTMAEAARIKGVSYHTVSRAVRQGRLRVQRLGRMALINGEDLDSWQPMRTKAPRRYRKETPEPDPQGTAIVLDDALGERLEVARQLSAIYEVMHAAAGELSIEGFGELLARRFASVFGLDSTAIWVAQPREPALSRVALFGPPMSRVPGNLPGGKERYLDRLADWQAHVLQDPVNELPGLSALADLTSVGALLLVPLRARGRVMGAIIGGRGGVAFSLADDELELAQVLANQAALAIDNLILRREEQYRIAQHAAILDQVTDLVRACDVNGRLEISNRADQEFRTVEGVSPPRLGDDAMMNPAILRRTELDGTPVKGDDHPLARALQGETIRDWEYFVTRVDGSVVRSRVSAQPLILDGEITGAVYIGRDVTEQRQQFEQLERQRAELERINEHTHALAELSDLLGACDSAGVAMTVAANLMGRNPGADALILAARAEGHFEPVAWSGIHDFDDLGPVHDPVSVPTAILAFSRQAPVAAMRQEAGSVERAILDASGAERLVVIPLSFAGQRLGVIYLLCSREFAFEPEEVNLLNVGGHLLAAAIARLEATWDA